jgi:hypothetical protein
VQSLLESVEYHPIGALDLSICPKMGNGDISVVDTFVLTVLPELVIVEVGAQVYDDAVG